MLCHARASPFNPSHLSNSVSQATCLMDVVFFPIPTYLLLLSLPFILMRRSKADRSSPTYRWWFYFDLLVVVLCAAMQILEIARLAIADQGVGLLPINLAGFVLAFGLVVYRQRGLGAILINHALIVFWVLLFIIDLIQVGFYSKLNKTYEGPKYKSSDKVVDLAVLAGLYAVLAISTSVQLVIQRRRSRR